MVMTYVGYTGSSYTYSRRDFYANGAALKIPKMFHSFDDKAGDAFVSAIKGNSLLRRRIVDPRKLDRLRSLANIVLEKVSNKFADKEFLEVLSNPEKEEEFINFLDKSS